MHMSSWILKGVSHITLIFDSWTPWAYWAEGQALTKFGDSWSVCSCGMGTDVLLPPTDLGGGPCFGRASRTTALCDLRDLCFCWCCGDWWLSLMCKWVWLHRLYCRRYGQIHQRWQKGKDHPIETNVCKLFGDKKLTKCDGNWAHFNFGIETGLFRISREICDEFNVAGFEATDNFGNLQEWRTCANQTKTNRKLAHSMLISNPTPFSVGRGRRRPWRRYVSAWH